MATTKVSQWCWSRWIHLSETVFGRWQPPARTPSWTTCGAERLDHLSLCGPRDGRMKTAARGIEPPRIEECIRRAESCLLTRRIGLVRERRFIVELWKRSPVRRQERE